MRIIGQSSVRSLAEDHEKSSTLTGKGPCYSLPVGERGQKGSETLTSIFMNVLNSSLSAEEALAGFLLQIAEVQVEKAFVGLIGGTNGNIA